VSEERCEYFTMYRGRCPLPVQVGQGPWAHLCPKHASEATHYHRHKREPRPAGPPDPPDPYRCRECGGKPAPSPLPAPTPEQQEIARLRGALRDAVDVLRGWEVGGRAAQWAEINTPGTIDKAVAALGEEEG
jgi:hypothetical protein